MDIIDDAAERQDIEMSRHLDAIRKKAKRRELEPKGACHWCEDPFTSGKEDPRLFCDSSCAADHHRHKLNKR